MPSSMVKEQASNQGDASVFPRFKLKDDFSQDALRSTGKNNSIEINYGTNNEEFLQSIALQLKGQMLTQEECAKHLAEWKSNTRLRRIDWALRLCDEWGINPQPTFSYRDPWKEQHPLMLPAVQKKTKRELGAVFMYFFNCPGKVNAKVSWSNNHVPGMDASSDFLKVSDKDTGYYNPRTMSFWYRELLDARSAGLQFLLLNTYGPDMEQGKLAPIVPAYEQMLKDGVKDPMPVGLFDDTWSWGKPYFGEKWKVIPDMAKTEECAQLIYTYKWKPFFAKVPREHWYLFQGKPLVYFYNGGTLKNRSQGGPVFARLKELFRQDFGVEPFICIDSAFANEEALKVADGSFVWYSLGKSVEDSTRSHKGVSLTHGMVRWDSTSRANKSKERRQRPGDKIYKDDTLLVKFLNDSKESDLAVMATWNDLGEGTGINRCTDYYWANSWWEPSVFMKQTRASQEGKELQPLRVKE
ncbi:MAG: DUF5010 domain-containing protein [Planctomycetes bacterium]|nr:DUF5010 domain-containing protein [Planctomycetota bacterium]